MGRLMKGAFVSKLHGGTIYHVAGVEGSSVYVVRCSISTPHTKTLKLPKDTIRVIPYLLVKMPKNRIIKSLQSLKRNDFVILPYNKTTEKLLKGEYQILVLLYENNTYRAFTVKTATSFPDKKNIFVTTNGYLHKECK